MTARKPADEISRASIWLMPSREDADLLRGIIAVFSRRFRTPEFEPHLTLAGDLPHPPGSYEAVLDELARASPPSVQPIEDVVLTDAYFRALYAVFGESPELCNLKERCAAVVGGTRKGFTPHVSLLYGSIPESQKKAEAEKLRVELRARRIAFDRVVVTNSSDNVPVHEWRMHATRTLRG